LHTVSICICMNTVTKVCLNCEKEFEALTKEVSRGYGKYCSKSCSSVHIGIMRKEQNSNKNLPNTSCTLCHKAIYVTVKRIKSSKHGVYFCCREHKDLALRKESGINKALPTHYKANEISEYRLVYLRAKNIICCELCNYDKIPQILEVHHKDRNRENNNLDNLIALCPNCHMEEHYHNLDGRWASKTIGESL